jgi:uncharacterized protein YqhQ
VPDRDHFYGGQALIEGVMMRGRDHWAVAVRRPDGSIHLESHEVKSIARRFPLLAKPGIRGVLALGQALTIGMRALTVSANESVEEKERLTTRQMAMSMAFAFVAFTVVFIIGPYVGFRTFNKSVHASFLRNVLEGLIRIALFVGYILLVGRMKQIRRVFEYHGAEHKTIAAYEHGDPLVRESIDKYSTLHVRCGTNFLLIVMMLTVVIYTLFGAPGIVEGILFRVVAIPVIAGLSYELLRIGAKYPRSRFVRALMMPGLWLQMITTKPPHPDQIEVAVASFEEVLRCEGRLTATEPEPEPEPLT